MFSNLIQKLLLQYLLILVSCHDLKKVLVIKLAFIFLKFILLKNCPESKSCKYYYNILNTLPKSATDLSKIDL